MERNKDSVLFENNDNTLVYPFLEQIDQLEKEINLISDKLSTHEKYIKDQKEISVQHLGLFNQTLEALKKDKEEILKTQKHLRCLTLTTQIWLGVSIILFSILLFRSFCF